MSWTTEVSNQPVHLFVLNCVNNVITAKEYIWSSKTVQIFWDPVQLDSLHLQYFRNENYYCIAARVRQSVHLYSISGKTCRLFKLFSNSSNQEEYAVQYFIKSPACKWKQWLRYKMCQIFNDKGKFQMILYLVT